MEDYIIAATDLNHALKFFEQELNKIDFSKLETVIEDGREVTYMPETMLTIDIDSKLRSMNETRSALLRKHPRFATFDEKEGMQYFRHSIRNSARVGERLLQLGYDLSRPTLKTRSEPGFDWGDGFGAGDSYMLDYYLYVWCNQPADQFVELSIIFRVDGSVCITSAGNSSGQANFALALKNGRWYYPDSNSPQNEVSGISHTHTYGGPAPSYQDYELKNTYPGITHSIYHGGAFRGY